MSSTRTIHRPAQPHRCQVGWKPMPLPDDHPARSLGSTHHMVMHGAYDPPGTVRECETCGKTWIGYREKVPARGMHTLTTQWRPEGRFERWRRQRRSARHARRREPSPVSASENSAYLPAGNSGEGS